MTNLRPDKITHCPIKDATIEIRFNTSLPKDAIYGIVYNHFRKKYPKEKKLPITGLPSSVLEATPELSSKPHYQLIGDKYIIQVGPQMFSFASTDNYQGWSNISRELKHVLCDFKKLKISDKITRAGVRYLNFFSNDFLEINDFNIFEHIELKYDIPFKDRAIKDMYIRTLIENGNYASRLTILNTAIYKGIHGSMIDIDTSFKQSDIDIDLVFKIICGAHEEEKNIFFDLLEDSFFALLK